MEITDFRAKFLAFVKAQPAEAKYDAGSCAGCALAQFVKSIYPTAYTGNWTYQPKVGGPCYDYPNECYNAAVPAAGHTENPYTWGRLANRLEALGTA